MRVRVLGSSAGGGLPQWNCGCANCQAAREGASNVRPRTQSSVAVSADDHWWWLLNVSADVRQQIAQSNDLAPRQGGPFRSTPIAGCVLTDAEIDHASGLLQLREGLAFSIYSTRLVRRWLNECFPIGRIAAAFADRPWRELPLDEPIELACVDGQGAGLEIIAFECGRDVPRFVPEETADAAGSVIGLRIRDKATGGVFVYAPGVAVLGSQLQQASSAAQLVLLDGSFWTDDEPRSMGICDRTSRQMGHVPVAGPGGSLQWLSTLSQATRVYVHVNNTNPMLDESGPEFALVRESDVHVGRDGDEFLL